MQIQFTVKCDHTQLGKFYFLNAKTFSGTLVIGIFEKEEDAIDLVNSIDRHESLAQSYFDDNSDLIKHMTYLKINLQKAIRSHSLYHTKPTKPSSDRKDRLLQQIRNINQEIENLLESLNTPPWVTLKDLIDQADRIDDDPK